MRALFCCVVLCAGLRMVAQQPRISVHDPVMIRQDSMYYLFATGRGIAVWSSPDRVHWTREQPVFSQPPAWAVEAVPGYRGHTWAPDISFHNGLYYLYYSASTFGKNTSAIGVATNPTLRPHDPAFHWTDHGAVIRSQQGKSHWNAIDPNLVFTTDSIPWLVFGSFWDGIQLVRLQPDLLQPVQPLEQYTIASRLKNSDGSKNNPIEAPFIVYKAPYYYFFVSTDYCCRGVNSTYKMMVGRSRNIKGPYLDKEGHSMAEGGGSLLLAGDERWHGVGHNGVYQWDGTWYLIYHGYDADDEGRSKLLIRPLDWKNDWPEAGEIIEEVNGQ